MASRGPQRSAARAPFGKTLPRSLLSGAVCLAAALAGVASGLALAAFALALAGRSLFEASPEHARLVLVVGPLVGLLPLAAMALAAERHRRLARSFPVAAVLWLAAASLCAYWFGVRPLLR